MPGNNLNGFDDGDQAEHYDASSEPVCSVSASAQIQRGCMNPVADNYDAEADVDDGSCACSVSGGAQLPPRESGSCPPKKKKEGDRYSECCAADKEKEKECERLNREHEKKMKELGCTGTSCKTGKIRRCPAPKRRKKKTCSLQIAHGFNLGFCLFDYFGGD